MKNRSVTPMRIAKTGYIIMSAVFCVVGVLFIALPAQSAVVIGRALGIAMVVFGIIKLVGYTVQGWTSLLCVIFLLGGIQIFCLGVIGEYIGKIFVEVKHRPRYAVKSMIWD